MTTQAKKKVPPIPQVKQEIGEELKLQPEPDISQYQQPKIGGRSSSQAPPSIS